MAAQNMGIGPVGSSSTTFKRKFRWTFQIQGFCQNTKNVVPDSYVKVAARPNLSIEEVEINHLNARIWIPGKAFWNTITVTYLDVATTDNMPLYNWIATVYNFTDPVGLSMAEKRDWDATGLLSMWDGCGNLIETWQLAHMFPTEVNWGDLDYATGDPAEIELTLRYSDVTYQSFCPAFTPTPCCTPCAA